MEYFHQHSVHILSLCVRCSCFLSAYEHNARREMDKYYHDTLWPESLARKTTQEEISVTQFVSEHKKTFYYILSINSLGPWRPRRNSCGSFCKIHLRVKSQEQWTLEFAQFMTDKIKATLVVIRIWFLKKYCPTNFFD